MHWPVRGAQPPPFPGGGGGGGDGGGGGGDGGGGDGGGDGGGSDGGNGGEGGDGGDGGADGGDGGGDGGVGGGVVRWVSAAATSKPPTVKLPSTKVFICSVRVGAVPAQSAACVTLRGVSTAATAAGPFDSVVLDVVPSNCHAQLAGSLPRHALTSMKWCVVVLCSRYSWISVHSSRIGLHVGFAVQRQQGGLGGDADAV